jgi:hypothetical protein
MSTEKPSSGNKQNPKKASEPSDGSGSSKKRKSAGFIETSGFKPNWLETGPLGPNILPEPNNDEESQLTTDEYEALQASLQRFYKQEEIVAPPDDEIREETENDVAPEEAPVPASPSERTAAPAAPEIERSNSDDTTENPPSSHETVMEESDAQEPIAADEPDAWIQALLERSEASTGNVGVAAPTGPNVDWDIEPTADTFIDDGPGETGSGPVAGPSTIVEPTRKRRREPRPKVKKRRDRLSAVLFMTSLLLLGAAALTYYVNPFARLALGTASLARPITSPSLAPPRTGSGEWCIRGDFLDDAGEARLIDSGGEGDILAEDQVYSFEYPVTQPGVYAWQVVDCNNPALVYPQAPAWFVTTEPDQTVTFIFDSNERADPLFFPIPFVVSAVDAATDYRIIGSFQDWNPDDTSGQLEQINGGLYQQVRRIARSGAYEAYVIAGEQGQAIDAYGRTTEPIPFSFETDRNGDYVVFLVDKDRGRASVMYDMPPLITSLAYGNGHLFLSLALAGLALVLFLGLLLRLVIMRNKRLRMEAGCPRCGEQELMRIARRPADRFLNLIGIPAYRYRCRNCTWEGTRLSDEGATISPGVTIAQINGN